MDEERVACPAAPDTAPEYSTARRARHSGRGGSRPSRPACRADGPAGAAGWPAAGGLWVAVDRDGPVRIVHVAGELDHESADGLCGALARPVEDGIERIVLDLGELGFCDSTGLNVLLHARLDAEAVGLRLELAGLHPAVTRLFAVTGADTVLRIHPDLGAALAASGRVPAAASDAPSESEAQSEPEQWAEPEQPSGEVSSARPGAPPGPV
ncbi:STAS domain-containing protein [Kitasatospora aureofaciens]|uniref:STAS domain-containing protein n=1 Tax=Kitasatospora aureofaciens TaxID=1894 RepID=UPI0033D07B60